MVMVATLLSLSWTAKAQTLSDYTLSVDTTTFNSIVSTGTQQYFYFYNSINNDDGHTYFPLPFTFPFGESTFYSGSSIACSANGFIYLGESSTYKSATGQYSDNFRAVNAILQQDGYMGRNSGAGLWYQYDTTAGTLTIEYHKLSTFSSPYDTYSYQVVFHNNGNIEFIYDEVVIAGTSRTLATYLTDGPNNDRLFVTGPWASPTLATAYASRPMNPAPVHGLRYTFTRPVITCPKPKNIAAVLTSGNGTVATLNWERHVNGTENAWVLEYSTNANFANATSVSVSGTPTLNLTGLTPETKYYARVKAICGEGDESPWSTTYAFVPTNKITIGTGEYSSDFLPTYTNFAYSYTQQIYTAAELGTAGFIDIIDFYMKQSDDCPRNLDVYMVSTDKNSFSSNTDWIPITEADKVFSGTVSFETNSWASITLDEGFVYDGQHNVAIIVYDKTYSMNSRAFAIYSTDEYQSICAISNNYEIDPNNIVAGTYTNVYRFLSKNQIRIMKNPFPRCIKPTHLVADTIGTHSAQLSWTDHNGATAWQLCVNGDETNLINVNTNPTYTLTNLTPEATYTVKVRSVCGGEDGVSEWGKTLTFTALTTKLVIGTDDYNNYQLPTSAWCEYYLSQQIYTATEIDSSGFISSIDFMNMASESCTRNLDVYLVHTEKEYFESYFDVIEVGPDDLVFSGPVTFAAGAWTTIPFDVDFYYNGTDNLAIVVDDNTGNTPSTWNEVFFAAFETPNNASIYMCEEENINPLEPIDDYGDLYYQKNQIRMAITPGLPSTCPKPTDLTIDFSGDASATLTWSSEASSFNIEVNGTVTTGVTSPYTLQNLDLDSTYLIKLQADCGNGQVSDWVLRKFITPMCAPEDMCEISYELHDSFGDGWNDNVILVVDSTTNAILARWSISSSEPEVRGGVDGGDNGNVWNGYSANGTLSVCTDTKLLFIFAQDEEFSSSSSEISWTVTDAYGEIIFQGDAPSTSFSQSYTMDCTPPACPKPTGLTVTDETGHGATISWNGNAGNYEVRVGELITTLIDSFGFEDPAGIPAFQNDSIYPWTLTDDDLHSGAYSFKSGGAGVNYVSSYLSLEINEPTAVTVSFWAKVSSESCCDLGYFFIDDVQKYESGDFNDWELLSFELPAGAHTLTWLYSKDGSVDDEDDCFYVDDIMIASRDVSSWSNYTVTGSPLVLNDPNIEPETTYEVQVRANCDNDSVSTWSHTSFTTAFCVPENQCEISYYLYDSYGDGWGGNKIQVVDVATGTILDTWTLLNGESSSGTLSVCDGRELAFQYVGWPSEEISWYITDENDQMKMIVSSLLESSQAQRSPSFTL